MSKYTLKLIEGGQLSIEEVYGEITHESDYVAIEKDDGTVNIELGAHFHKSLCDIEEFVEKIELSKNIDELFKVDLSLVYKLVSVLVLRHRENYAYTPRVTAFFKAVQRVFGHGDYDPKLFRNFIVEIKAFTTTKEFQDKLRKWKYNFKRSHLSATKYVDALFEIYARLLVIRIDLGFARNGHVTKTTLEEAKAYFSKFLNAKRSNKIFDDVVGYVWKLECGDIKGYHFHMLIFMDGSKVMKDEYRAMLMGQYWRGITDGKGSVFISNYIKSAFAKRGRLGIGMIPHSDVEKRRNLDSVIQYFFKAEQCLKEKSTEGSRTNGRGEMPIKARIGLGRPRLIRSGP